jgi:hypothetical protein
MDPANSRPPSARFSDRLRSLARGAASAAAEAFTGLDAMAAADGHIHAPGGGGGGGGGGASSASARQHELRKQQQQRERQQQQEQQPQQLRRHHSHHHPPANSDFGDDNDGGGDAAPSWHRSHSLPVGPGGRIVDDEAASTSAGSRGGLDLPHPPPASPLWDGLAPPPGSLSFVPPSALDRSSRSGGPRRDEGGDRNGGRAPLAERGGDTTGGRKKDSRRFLADLEDRIRRPNEAPPGKSPPEKDRSAGGPSWSGWLAAAAGRAPSAASSSAPSRSPGPLLARAPRLPGRAGGGGDEFQVRSSASVLGDDERAELAALMGGGAGRAAPANNGSDAVAAASASSPARLVLAAVGRREALVGATLVLAAAAYWWARDRASLDGD